MQKNTFKSKSSNASLFRLPGLIASAALSMTFVAPAMAVVQSSVGFTENGGRRVISLGNSATLPSTIDALNRGVNTGNGAGENLFGLTSNGLLGWPIGPRAFLGVRHDQLSPGSTLSFDNQTFTVASVTNMTGTFAGPNNTTIVGNSDIAIYTINANDPSFTRFSPLFTPSDNFSPGRELVVYGRGTSRGNAITALASGGNTRGWASGEDDRQISWGTNRLESIRAISLGSLENTTVALTYNFSPEGDPDGTLFEGGLTASDSSGAVFARTSTGEWKLAALNSAVDGPVGHTADQSLAQQAVVFDASGLFAGIIDGLPANNGSYALRTSGRTSSFSTFVGFPEYANVLQNFVPEPTTLTLLCGVIVLGLRRR